MKTETVTIDAEEVLILHAALHEIEHFGMQILAWEAEKTGLVNDKSRLLVVFLAGVEHDDKGTPFLIFHGKVFTTKFLSDEDYDVGKGWQVVEG